MEIKSSMVAHTGNPSSQDWEGHSQAYIARGQAGWAIQSDSFFFFK